jgi:16S rRNA (cytosine967-C5)-methyltransferase
MDHTLHQRDEEADAVRRPSDADEGGLWDGARAVAVRVLTRVEQSDAYLDKLLNYELTNADLNEADRRLLNEIATGVLRWQGRLDWILTGFYHGEFSRCIPLVKNALRIALYQILFLDRIPHAAAVNEAVKFVKRLKGERSANMVNGVLRSILRKLNAITYPDRNDDLAYFLSVTESHPLWLVRRWMTQMDSDTVERLLVANNRRPVLSVRHNQMIGTIDELAAIFRDEGATVEQSSLLPEFLHVHGLHSIAGSSAYAQGRFTIQDEGAALAVRLADVRPGMRVIDLCAAPGGKSIAMAEIMNGEGTILAVDKYEAKLKLVSETVARLHFESIVVPVVGDARTFTSDSADVVFIDAPCSGLGVLSKKPDIKWKRRVDEIVAMVALQRSILENAANLVRPGGHLIYSTCTIEESENRGVVEWFLSEHPEFELVNASSLLPADVVTSQGYMQTIPGTHPVDGMFAARMRRK